MSIISPLATYVKVTQNKSKRTSSVIDTVTIHCIVGQWTAKQGVDYFNNTSVQASANYVVGKDGSIGCCVPEEYRSWCTGSSKPLYVNGHTGKDNDHRAITIEVASDTSSPYAVTDKAYNALIELLADICKRNPAIGRLRWKNDKSLAGKTDQQNMTAHCFYANKSCPGQYLYSRFGAIADAVNAKIDNNTIQSNTEEEEEVTQEQFNEMMTVWMNQQAEIPPSWEQTEMDWAVNKGLIVGATGPQNTMPKKPMTRGEVVTVLHRFAEILAKAAD